MSWINSNTVKGIIMGIESMDGRIIDVSTDPLDRWIKLEYLEGGELDDYDKRQRIKELFGNPGFFVKKVRKFSKPPMYPDESQEIKFKHNKRRER